MNFQSCILICCLILVCQTGLAEKPKFTRTSEYNRVVIQQFTILIHPDVKKHPEAAKQMRMELEKQLVSIHRVVPAQVIAKLKHVRIWVEWKNNPKGAAVFHPSKNWLIANGYNPDKASCIEISNVENFVKWSQKSQPWMVLHELAHAHHFLNLGVKNKAVLAAYESAKKRKQYENVEHVSGKTKLAYAMKNHKEYFAEISEAYFGKNDFYPFNATELKKHDPLGYDMLVKSWGKPN